LLREALIPYSVGRKPLEMLERLVNPFSAEAIQGPEKDTIELPTTGRRKHLLEAFPVRMPSADLIGELIDDCPALLYAEFSELPELIGEILTVSGGNATVKGEVHE
jgi:hypothetical protein